MCHMSGTQVRPAGPGTGRATPAMHTAYVIVRRVGATGRWRDQLVGTWRKATQASFMRSTCPLVNMFMHESCV
jgi:hypothetical protein